MNSEGNKRILEFEDANQSKKPKGEGPSVPSPYFPFLTSSTIVSNHVNYVPYDKKLEFALKIYVQDGDYGFSTFKQY
jgi:hypothetical protein